MILEVGSDSATSIERQKSSLKYEILLLRNFVFRGILFRFIDYFRLFLARENTLPLVLVSNIIIFHCEERTGFMEEHTDDSHHKVLQKSA